MHEADKGIYRKLGVKPVINAFETVTMYGGSLMRPEVLDAMRDASTQFVSIPELHRKVGEELARLTNNEAAWVTAGCAAALALALAACMTRVDAKKVSRLPCTDGMKNEVIVHRCQRNSYDRALLLPGAQIVEFGYPIHRTTSEQLEAAISEKSAAIFYFAGKMFERYALPLEKVVNIGQRYQIPVIVDAAAQLPPKENLWHYTGIGADLALFSGGKGIRGPQDSGLIVGKKVLMKAIEMNSAPYHAFGRPMKTTKENIVGLLQAVELFLQTDHKAEYQRMKQQAKEFFEALGDISGIETYLLSRGRHGQQYPRAVVRLQEELNFTREELMTLLEYGDPTILVGPLDEDDRAFYINPFGLRPGEEKIVATKIREILLS
jgi:L-seryl-tRNA(Ser) seleniumtransferase